MKYYKKGDLKFTQLIEVLLGVIILILMIFFVYDFLNDSYDSEVNVCNFFVSNLDGKPKYFGGGLDTITSLLLTSVSDICPSKDVELSQTKMSDTAKLLTNCYSEIGAGKDFFGAGIEDKSVCIHCGFVKVVEDIDNFNIKFSKMLIEDRYRSLFNNESEMVNTNKIFLSSKGLMSNVEQGEYLRVLGYAYKPKFDSEGSIYAEATESFTSTVSRFFGIYGSSLINYLIADSSIDGFSGVYIEKFEEYGEFNAQRNINFTNGGSSIGCSKVIIPTKNYD